MNTFSLACADSGAVCPASFTTESEGELMQHVEVQAKMAYPDMMMDDAVVAQVKGLSKTSGGPELPPPTR